MDVLSDGFIFGSFCHFRQVVKSTSPERCCGVSCQTHCWSDTNSGATRLACDRSDRWNSCCLKFCITMIQLENSLNIAISHISMTYDILWSFLSRLVSVLLYIFGTALTHFAALVSGRVGRAGGRGTLRSGSTHTSSCEIPTVPLVALPWTDPNFNLHDFYGSFWSSCVRIIFHLPDFWEA